MKKLSPKSYSQAGPVTVRSLKTGEVLRVEAPLPGGVGPGDTLVWWKSERRVPPAPHIESGWEDNEDDDAD